MAGIAKTYRQFEVWQVALEPVAGSEMAKTRPCVIISPDEMNKYLHTVIIAPLTSTRKDYPFRLNCTFQNYPGQIALDHIRSVDKKRLVTKLGIMDEKTNLLICDLLIKIFSY